MKPNTFWWNTAPDGDFNGPFDTLEDALEDASFRAFEDEPLDTESEGQIFVTQPTVYDFEKVAKNFLFDFVCCVDSWAHDEGGECSEGYTDQLDLTPLQSQLAEVLKANHVHCRWLGGNITAHIVENGWFRKYPEEKQKWLAAREGRE